MQRSEHVIGALFRRHHLPKVTNREWMGVRQEWRQGDLFGGGWRVLLASFTLRPLKSITPEFYALVVYLTSLLPFETL